ncbi:hypothetical protein FOZ60_010341 [Perkinsus olseni]|uniref:Peptidase A1 domain-containing protein n=1 Tax=Perkinsus olseni TaxID=32597 RepID=A0A7J6PBW8_PEROL|nr:hypothetical protein FOZ60_010341 [Perkinsus olseni]
MSSIASSVVWVFVLQWNLGSMTKNGLMRLPIVLKEVRVGGGYETYMLAPMRVDGSFFIEEEFLKTTRSPKVCADLVYGCYKCSTDLCKAKRSEQYYYDGTCAYTAEHRGTLELGGKIIPNADFGLVVKYTPQRCAPHASLGLAPFPSKSEVNSTPLLDQLVDRGFIRKGDFSIYFNPNKGDEAVEKGELILGGEDPSKYRGPMLTTPLLEPTDLWTVTLDGLVVDGQSMLSSSTPLDIDSGTSNFWLPYFAFLAVRKTLETSATAAADRPIKFERTRKGTLTLPNCTDRSHLPSLELYFHQRHRPKEFSNSYYPDKRKDGGWPIVVPPEFYVQRFADGQGEKCVLLLHYGLKSKGSPLIGLNLLRKYYVHFRSTRRQIGFAELAQTDDDPLKSVGATKRGQKRRREASDSGIDLKEKRLRVDRRRPGAA